MNGRPIRQCRHPWTWMLIGPDGRVRPCCHTSVELGNITRQSVEDIWNSPALMRLRGSIRDGYVDRICRYAPCTYVREMEQLFGMDAYDFNIELGRECRDDIARFCFSGWHAAESWGVWSANRTAILYFNTRETKQSSIKISVLCRAAVNEEFPFSYVRIMVNGHLLDRWEFTHPESIETSAWKTVDVPARIIDSPRIELRFEIERPFAARLINPNDTRELGIAVSSLKVIQI